MRLGELRRIIRESIGDGDLGVVVEEGPGTKLAVLYSTSSLLKVIDSVSDDDFQEFSDVASAFSSHGVVVGFIKIRQLDAPCHGAWEVVNSWGPGRGKDVYGVGYAMSPSGRLVSSRSSVSRAARGDRDRGGWAKASRSRMSFVLDDLYAEPQDKLTPDDPDDDCELYKPISAGGPDPVLDRAYDAQGWEVPAFEAMVSRHEGTMEEVLKIDPDETRRRVEQGLIAAGRMAFNSRPWR
jgi:hypothetical protein